jgi:hypothetical protein
MADTLSGWIDWQAGDKAPTPPDAPVIVKFRDGSEGKARKVSSLRWEHLQQPDDIVAYRRWS